MIYTARKNGQTRRFSDADGKPILAYYRRRCWRITAELGKLKERPRPALRIKEKPIERRERRLFTTKKGGKDVTKAVNQ